MNTLKSTAERKGHERRRSERRPHVAEAWIASPTASGPEDDIEVTSLNISRHGVGFELTKPLAEDAFYAMEIGVGDQRLISEVRVISCRKLENGKFDVGAEFC